MPSDGTASSMLLNKQLFISLLKAIIPIRAKRRAKQIILNLDLYRRDAEFSKGTTANLSGNGINVKITPQDEYPFTKIAVEANGKQFNEPLLYSHLGLAKFITEYNFDNVLEIGSAAGVASRVFKFLGKKVHTVEILDTFEASTNGDYLEVEFPEKFDAIWCSHVLEHQRHVGMFCEKMFNDLKEGGVLAITVPTSLSPLVLGHCNIFTPLHLIYNLILAGFDCSDVKLKCYDWQMSLLLKKKTNSIKNISFATTEVPNNDYTKLNKNCQEIGVNPQIINYFPSEIAKKMKDGYVWGEIDEINWQ